MRTVGEGIQARSWESLLEAVVAESGGAAVSAIQHEEETLPEDKAALVEAWVRELIAQRKGAKRNRPVRVTPQTDGASFS